MSSQKIIRCIWILFNCVVLVSCVTPRLKLKTRLSTQIQTAIQTNNRQKLVDALESTPRSVERHITLAKSIGNFGIRGWEGGQQSHKNNREVDAEELFRAYDFFLKEVHYNIKQGIKYRDSERALSGLLVFSRLSFLTEEHGASDLKEIVSSLLKNNLEKFKYGNVDELDYRQLEEDYNQFMEACKNYFIALVL